jgi:hypothetical protein
MNANTIVSFQGGTGRNQIGLQTLASTVETEFKVNQDAGANNAIAVLTIPQGNEILGSSNPLNINANSAILGNDRGSQFSRGLGEQSPWFSNTAFDMAKFGVSFRLRLSAFYTAVANAANSLVIKIYSGSTKGGTVIATNTAVATASAASGNLVFEVDLQWDSTTQALVGNQRFRINYNATQVTNGFSAGAILTNAASVTTLAGLTFCASATWGNAVGGTIQVNEFCLEGV